MHQASLSGAPSGMDPEGLTDQLPRRLAGEVPTTAPAMDAATSFPTRRRRCLRLGLAALAVSTLTVPVLWGQPPAELPAFSEEVDVAWVLVPVVVRSAKGYVEGMSRKDFRLFVDGRPVPIASFDAETSAPVSLVWLQDLSGSMGTAGRLTSSRRALGYFLDRAQPGDGFALATFAGGQLQVDVPFTSDRDLVAEAGGLWEAYGTTSLYDAIAWVPELSATGSGGRRAVVLVTDGVDNASALAPKEARMLVQKAELPVYVVGFTPIELSAGTAAQDPVYRYAHLLNVLARATGGRYHSVPPAGDVLEAAAVIEEDLRHQYLLGFPARAGEGGERRFRRIRVELKGNRPFEIRYRQGYRGGVPSTRTAAGRP